MKPGFLSASTWLVPAIVGALAGAMTRLSQLAEMSVPQLAERSVGAQLGVGGILGAALLVTFRLLLERAFLRQVEPARRAIAERRLLPCWAVFLLVAIEAGGLRVPGYLLPAGILLVFSFAAAWALSGSTDSEKRGTTPTWIAFVFACSGVAALIYQVCWQRILFASFGVNIESATVVVTLFMAGLGLGSLLGGWLSQRYSDRLLRLFLTCELLIGLFGLVSLPLIEFVGDLTVRSSLPVTAVVIFGCLLLPTMLMGATLPLLTDYTAQRLGHVGRSVGLLYFVNTLGSAAACFLTADVLFVFGGRQAAVFVAAAFNFGVSAMVWWSQRATASVELPAASGDVA